MWGGNICMRKCMWKIQNHNKTTTVAWFSLSSSFVVAFFWQKREEKRNKEREREKRNVLFSFLLFSSLPLLLPLLSDSMQRDCIPKTREEKRREEKRRENKKRRRKLQNECVCVCGSNLQYQQFFR